MSPPDSPHNSVSNQNNRSRSERALRYVSNTKPPIQKRIRAFRHRMFGKKRAILIKRNSIEVHWFDFSEKQNLPFDPETYEDTQLFLGNWANPWYVNIEEIENHYPDFTEDTITEVDDVFEKNHIYPSQKYKLFMNQQVLKDMFIGGRFNQERIMRLLYAVVGGVALIAILLLSGGI